MRSLRPIALAIVAATTLAPAARADSIVYQKGGDLFLTSPDGSRHYQVTTGGGWTDPSQSDNGMIVAMQDGLIYRLDRSGRVIGSPIQGIGGATDHVVNGTTQFYGPFDPQVSPDGSRIAYWDTVSEQTTDYNCGCVKEELVNIATTTASDHFTSAGFISRAEMPHWIHGSDRVVATNSGQEPQAITWETSTGQDGEQWWFRDGQYVVQDIALSPDGSRVAAMGTTNGITAPDDTVRLWATNGPAFTGQPPYDNNAPGAQFPPAPTVICNNHHGGEQLSHPSWAPDSSAVAFDTPEGIWVNRLSPGMSDCGGLHEQLLIPGGQQPSWGPADVDPSQAPGASGSPGGGTPGGGTPGGGTPGGGTPGGGTPGGGTPGGGTPGGGTPGGGTPGGGTPGGGTPGGGDPGHRLVARLSQTTIAQRTLAARGLGVLVDGLTRGRLRLTVYAGHRVLVRLTRIADQLGRGQFRLRLHRIRRGTRLRIVVAQGAAASTVIVAVT